VQLYPATLNKDPVDIVLIVDNSCSMGEEMKAVQTNINPSFAQPLTKAGLDYRVILIGEHGQPDQASLCIDPPLGGSSCAGVGIDVAPTNNPPVFFHYDNNDVESWDSWCKIMDWYDKPDRYNLAPNGWSGWLRASARKSFVEISDDRVDCTYPSTAAAYPACNLNGPKCFDDGNTQLAEAPLAAQQFDLELLALSSLQFGTVQSRNYVWHSVVGVMKNSASPTGAYDPTEALVPNTAKCPTAVNAGLGYQALSMLTGGLRFPVCEGVGFDAVLETLAERIVGEATHCDVPLPDPPSGKELDLAALAMQYTLGTGSPVPLNLVADVSQCGPTAFYLAAGSDGGANGSLVLCPGLCTQLKTDSSAKLEIVATCK